MFHGVIQKITLSQFFLRHGVHSGTTGICCCTGMCQTLHVHWPDGSTFLWFDVMAAVLKAWRYIGNQTPSIEAYLLEEQSCQISSLSNLKQWSLRFFWSVVPEKEKKNKKKKTISDTRIGSVPEILPVFNFPSSTTVCICHIYSL